MPTFSQKRSLERAHLAKLKPSEHDPKPSTHGVLLADAIEFYVTNCELISPFSHDNLKPAGYELSVGDEYFISGEFLEINNDDDKENQKIVIPPFDVVVLKTQEILCIPRYMIARWNLKVKHAYSGLLWVGGPQVDAGYKGHLFCPIYNLSDKPVTLYKGDPIAVIDFVKTTPFPKNKPNVIRYPEPKKPFIENFGIDSLRSALFTKAGQKLVEIESEVKSLGQSFFTFTQISFAIFALVIALVTTTTKFGAESISLGASFWGFATISLSICSILMTFFSYMTKTANLIKEQPLLIMGRNAAQFKYFLRNAWWSGIILSIIVSIMIALWISAKISPSLQNFRTQELLTKADLTTELAPTANNIKDLSNRLSRVEGNRSVSLDDFERLRSDMEREIKTYLQVDKQSKSNK